MQVEKSVRRRIESFLLGNSGPEAFYEVQENIVQLLKEKVYPNFVLTDFYNQFLQNIESTKQGTFIFECLVYLNPFIMDLSLIIFRFKQRKSICI